MATAALGDVALAYETRGEAGSPVLLIMGFTVPGSAWRFQLPALAERHRVCAFDNRGSGQSDAPPGPYSMGLLAADAVGLLDHLGWADAHIVGVSMGGMVAQHVALDHRARVRSLTLIATNAGGFFNRLPRPAGAWHFLRGTLGPRRGRLDAAKDLLFPRAFQAEADPDWLRDVLTRDFGTRPPREGRRGQLRAVFGHDTRDRLAELAGLPTLIVKPELDVLVRPSQSELLHARIPGSEILRLADAGHGVLRQSRDVLNPRLLAHLAAADVALDPHEPESALQA